MKRFFNKSAIPALVVTLSLGSILSACSSKGSESVSTTSPKGNYNNCSSSFSSDTEVHAVRREAC